MEPLYHPFQTVSGPVFFVKKGRKDPTPPLTNQMCSKVGNLSTMSKECCVNEVLSTRRKDNTSESVLRGVACISRQRKTNR